MNRGPCLGGPHDGDLAEGEGDYFRVILKQHPDVRRPDGMLERRIDYGTYYWVQETKSWRWGTDG